LTPPLVPDGGRSPLAGVLSDARSAHYFRTHVFVPLSHTPLAFSQSAGVLYFEKSSELCEGLAEGELDESPDAPGDVVVPPDPVEASGALLVPLLEAAPALGPPAPCRGLFGLVLPGAPLLTCAVAKAGARAMTPAKSVNITICMSILPLFESPRQSDGEQYRRL
jgi:hypothetical protein